jgi:hypothetical protein
MNYFTERRGGSDIGRGAAKVTTQKRSTMMCYSRHIFRQWVGAVKHLDKPMMVRNSRSNGKEKFLNTLLRWSYYM